MLTLLAIQQALQQLASNQENQVPVVAPAPPVVEPILDELVQGVTLTNADNLSTTRQPASLAEEPIVFMTRVEVDAILRGEKEKASSTATCLNLKPPY